MQIVFCRLPERVKIQSRAADAPLWIRPAAWSFPLSPQRQIVGVDGYRINRPGVPVENCQRYSVIIASAGGKLDLCKIPAVQPDIADGAKTDSVWKAPGHSLPKLLSERHICCRAPSDPDDAPDVVGGGEGKDQAGKEDHRPSPLKLAMLLVVEVSHT